MLPVQIDEIVNLLDLLSEDEKKKLASTKEISVSLNSTEFIILVDGTRSENLDNYPTQYILEGHVTVRKVNARQESFSILTCRTKTATIIEKNLVDYTIEESFKTDPFNIAPHFHFYKPETLPKDPEEFALYEPILNPKTPIKSVAVPMEVKEVYSKNFIMPDGSKLSYQSFEVKTPMALFLYTLYRPLYVVFDPNDHDKVKSVDILINFDNVENVRPIVVYKSEAYRTDPNQFPYIGQTLQTLKLPEQIKTIIVQPKLIPYEFKKSKDMTIATHYNNYFSFSQEQVKRNDLWLEVSPVLSTWAKWQAYKTIAEKPLNIQFLVQDKRGGKTFVDVKAQITLPLSGK